MRRITAHDVSDRLKGREKEEGVLGIDMSAISQIPTETASGRREFSKIYRGYVLAVIAGVYALNILDRTVLLILQEMVKRDLALSDTQLALLNGLAFHAFYAVASLAFARWADTGTRRSVLSVAIFVWSLSTAACGMVGSYIHLLFARSAVGAGEAGSAPTSHSMIADMYPVEKRGMALGILTCGVFLGQFLGMSIGGWMGSHYGWRHTLFLLGIVGIGFVLIVRATVAEPPRQKASSEEAIGLLPLCRMLCRSSAWLHLMMGSALFCTLNSINGFMPSFVLRTHVLPLEQAGVWLGLMGGIGGTIGVLGGGFATDRLSRKGLSRLPWISVAAMLVATPLLISGMATMSVPLIMISYFSLNMAMAANLSAGILITYSLVPDRARARASATYLLIQNLFGVSITSFMIGAVSDSLVARYGSDSLRYAMMTVLMVAAAWMMFHMQRASHHLRKAERLASTS